jgi:hypothetical protein
MWELYPDLDSGAKVFFIFLAKMLDGFEAVSPPSGSRRKARVERRFLMDEVFLLLFVHKKKAFLAFPLPRWHPVAGQATLAGMAKNRFDACRLPPP